MGAQSCTRSRSSAALETTKPERLLQLSPEMLASLYISRPHALLLLLASLEPVGVLLVHVPHALVPRSLGYSRVPVRGIVCVLSCCCPQHTPAPSAGARSASTLSAPARGAAFFESIEISRDLPFYRQQPSERAPLRTTGPVANPVVIKMSKPRNDPRCGPRGVVVCVGLKYAYVLLLSRDRGPSRVCFHRARHGPLNNPPRRPPRPPRCRRGLTLCGGDVGCASEPRHLSAAVRERWALPPQKHSFGF